MKQIFTQLFFRDSFFVLFCLVGLSSARAQEIIIIKPEFFHFDAGKNLILINAPGAQLLSSADSVRGLAAGGHQYALVRPVARLSTRAAYLVTAGGRTYTACFSRLPLIQLTAKRPIVDAPSVYATFSLTDTSGVTTQSALRIEVRGGHSQTFPKKSYELGLLTDTVRADGQDLALLGMRADNKWNLQAMYNDPLRVRIKTANELWQDMSRLYY